MKRFLLVPALLCAALLYAVADGESGIRTWLALRTDLGEARERVAGIRHEIRDLERDTAALEGDPFAIERAIREDLELARAGELLVRLSGDSVTNTRFP